MQVRLKNIPLNDADAVRRAPTSILAIRGDLYKREIELAARVSKWKDKWHAPGKGKAKGPIKHGIGMALHTWGGQAAGPNECTVLIASDGSVTARTSTQDLGTSSGR